MNRLLFGDNLKWLRMAKVFPDACTGITAWPFPSHFNLKAARGRWHR
jgi:hypothetical protein